MPDIAPKGRPMLLLNHLTKVQFPLLGGQVHTRVAATGCDDLARQFTNLRRLLQW